MSLDNVDQQLVNRCRGGDQAAFNELYDQLKDDLYRWIYSIMRNYDDTEEVFQETTIRLFRHIGSLRKAGSFSSWLYRLVINQCNSHRKREGRKGHASLDESIEVKPDNYVFRQAAPESPGKALMRKEIRAQINDHISRLPKKQRMAVLLFDVKGYSIREVAEQLGSSEGAVKFNIHEGRKKLRASLDPLMDGFRDKGDK